MLNQQRLAEALHYLHKAAEIKDDNEAAFEAEQLLKHYELLLHYLEQDMEDPTRLDQFNSIFSKTWDLTDRLSVSHQRAEDEYLSDSIALQMVQNFEFSGQQGKERDLALGKLFVRIRQSLPLTKELCRALHELMLDDNMPEFERAVVLSAITINLLQRFDPTMLEYIYTYTLEEQTPNIRVRAYVALVLCGMKYDIRIRRIPRLSQLYQLLVETEDEMLAAIQVSLLQCSKAKSFYKRLSNVVKMELGKVRTGKAHMSFKEFFSLFHDGVDPDYEIFAHVFQKMPFFSQAQYEHHWLTPFSAEQYWMRQLTETRPEAEKFIMLMSSSLSQSDAIKYAHISLAATNMETIAKQLTEQAKELPIDLDNVVQLDVLSMMRSYLHDFYRFVNLSDAGKELHYQMDELPDFNDVECLREANENLDRLEAICRMLCQQNNWSEASKRLMRLTRQRVTQELLELLAISAEKCGEYRTAQEALLRLMALFTPDQDSYLHLAKLYDKDNCPVAEEKVLHDALKAFPDHVPLMLQMGICLNSQNRVKEALPLLLHASTLQDLTQTPILQHQMSYAHLMLQQPDEAEQDIAELLKSPEAEDQDIALGIIIALNRDDFKTATIRYKELVSRLGPEQAFKMLWQKKEIFRLSGTDLSALTLLNDLNK